MLFNVKEDTLDINGVRMDYAAFGSGKRTLVLIHGLALMRRSPSTMRCTVSLQEN